MSRTTETKYVARFPNGSFAREGHETGFGRAIVSTPNVLDAMLSSTVSGLMRWMGGHYRQTEAVPVTIVTDVEIGDPVAYPDESLVWPTDEERIVT